MPTQGHSELIQVDYEWTVSFVDSSNVGLQNQFLGSKVRGVFRFMEDFSGKTGPNLGAFSLSSHKVSVNGVDFETGVRNLDGNLANRIWIGNDLGSRPEDQISISSTVSQRFRGVDFLAFGLVFGGNKDDALPSSNLTREIFNVDWNVGEGRFFFQQPNSNVDIMVSSQNSFDAFTVSRVPVPLTMYLLVFGLIILGSMGRLAKRPAT